MTSGKQIFEAPISEKMNLYRNYGKRQQFQTVDNYLSKIIKNSLSGKAIIDINYSNKKGRLDEVKLKDKSEVFQKEIEKYFTKQIIEAKGSWYLQDKINLEVGVAQIPFQTRNKPRLIIETARSSKGRFSLEDYSPIILWSSIIPLMEALLLPLAITKYSKEWEQVERIYSFFQIPEEYWRPLQVDKRQGTGAREHLINLKYNLIENWQYFDLENKAIFWHIDRLVNRYYLKASPQGQAEKSRVLNKETEESLIAAFGGDWLSFVEYIGETPSKNEKTITSIPEPNLFTSNKSQLKTSSIEDVETEKIAKILESYWGGNEKDPIAEREEFLKKWWNNFQTIHSNQKPRSNSLWGLTEGPGECISKYCSDNGESRPYNSEAYLLFQEDILKGMRKFWEQKI